MKFLAAISLPAYALDQLTKWWIFTHYALVPSERNLAQFPEIVAKTAHLPLDTDVIPGWFQIVHWGNTGAAFSFLSDHPWVFIGISVAAFIGLLVAWTRNVFTDAPSRIAVPLLLGGILGNVTDRLVHGYVVDFLLFDLHVRFADPWPAFNVADTCICVAAGLFVIAAIRDTRKPRES
ncbi:MAG: signal peptidase II [Chthoniobacteraceae bacterium]